MEQATEPTGPTEQPTDGEQLSPQELVLKQMGIIREAYGYKVHVHELHDFTMWMLSGRGEGLSASAALHRFRKDLAAGTPVSPGAPEGSMPRKYRRLLRKGDNG